MIGKKKRGQPRNTSGQVIIEKCPEGLTQAEKDRFNAKMRQRVRWAKIGASEKAEM